MALNRRAFIVHAAAASLVSCQSEDEPRWRGGWVGARVDRGHRLRDGDAAALPPPAFERRVATLVIGAGIAGLAAARTLQRAGLDDVHVFDLEDSAGGNSRGHVMAGLPCPLGAHYLPLPGEHAWEVIELLEDFGLRRQAHGRAVYDERHLCHSPQERLYLDGHWHDGLLPPLEALPAAERAGTRADYERFSATVDAVSRLGFAMPTARAAWTDAHTALDAIPFSQWLDAQGLHSAALRWYLDYCCRDDYGAGAVHVSAWAGLHYFASRHGFHAESRHERAGDNAEGVLTWPEGNAWLSRRLAASLGERWHAGQVVVRVTENRHDVAVDVWNVAAQRLERWRAAHVVLSVPLFVAARLLTTPPAALMDAVAALRYAPWLVSNLQLSHALDDRPGAAPSWDNVIYQSPTLGYVDAGHQSLLPYADATVLTAYWALGGHSKVEAAAQRTRLLNAPWSMWAAAVVGDLAPAHPDLERKLVRVDSMRYGHAMSIPAPGVRSSSALRALGQRQPSRIEFAHSDLAAYSVFEEALYHGVRAARAVLEKNARAPRA